jgi:hypothetical protein
MYYKDWTKSGLGFILGDFFTNSSGHPAFYEEILNQSDTTKLSGGFLRPVFNLNPRGEI